MPKKKKEEDKEEEVLDEAKSDEVFFVRDSNDRDFRLNGIDLVLNAGEAKEVSSEVYKELKEKFPYLEFIK